MTATFLEVSAYEPVPGSLISTTRSPSSIARSAVSRTDPKIRRMERFDVVPNISQMT